MTEEPSNRLVPLDDSSVAVWMAKPDFHRSTSGDPAEGLSRLFVVAFIVLIAVLAGRVGAGHSAELDALLAEAAANNQTTVDRPSSAVRTRAEGRRETARESDARVTTNSPARQLVAAGARRASAPAPASYTPAHLYPEAAAVVVGVGDRCRLPTNHRSLPRRPELAHARSLLD